MEAWRRVREGFTGRMSPGQALLRACADGDPRRIQALLASVPQQLSPADRGRALVLAAQNGHAAAAEALLAVGGHRLIRQDAVTLAMQEAAFKDHTSMSVLDLLSRYYPALFASDEAARILRESAVNLKWKPIQALLRGGTPPDLRCRGHPPALFYAAAGSVACVLELLEAGADPDTMNDEGLTALHCASASKDHLSAALLVASGANLFATDRQGRMPIDLAQGRMMRRLLRPRPDQHPPRYEAAVPEFVLPEAAPPEYKAAVLQAPLPEAAPPEYEATVPEAALPQ